MRIRTILNKIYKHKSFVYTNERLETIDGRDCLVVDVEPRKNSKPICSGCGKVGSIYDHQSQARRFEFIPMWGIVVYLCYQMRRVTCKACGVKVEQVPWAKGKNQLTTAYQIFLAQWARRLSWKEVADVFNTSWRKVFASVSYVVEYGLKNRVLSGIKAIGIDEIHFGQGHNYLTVVYQLDESCRRLLYVGKRRTAKTLLKFFRQLDKDCIAGIEYVCTDMWKAFQKVIRKKLPHALHILDRFHIVALLNKAVDEVRRSEAKTLKAKGYEPVLKNSKYVFLKNPENLTEKQEAKLNELIQYDLKSIRAYMHKESFQAFWQYRSPYWAERYLKLWCNRVMRSKLEPLKKFVKTVRRHEPIMMNWFKAKGVYSSGAVEGLNRKVNLVTRKAYGFKRYEVLEIALFHTMGGLPEPKTTHRFC